MGVYGEILQCWTPPPTRYRSICADVGNCCSFDSYAINISESVVERSVVAVMVLGGIVVQYCTSSVVVAS